MMENRNFICYWREKRGLSKAELSRISGVDRSTITRLEQSGRGGNYETLATIAKSLQISTDVLINGPIVDASEITFDINETIPLLGKIPAGPWTAWVDSYPPGYADEFVPRYDLKGKSIFALRVDGDSMEPELHNGDIVVVNPEIAFQATHGGKIGVIRFEDNYKIRRVHMAPDGNNYLLEPLNKVYDTEVIPVTGTTIFKIIELRPRKEGLF